MMGTMRVRRVPVAPLVELENGQGQRQGREKGQGKGTGTRKKKSKIHSPGQARAKVTVGASDKAIGGFTIAPESARFVRRAPNEKQTEAITKWGWIAEAWAKKYANRDQTLFEELRQEGYLGIIRATQKYDPTKNTKFNTYATVWVKARILRYLKKQNSLVSRNWNRIGHGYSFDLSLNVPFAEDGDEDWIDILADSAVVDPGNTLDTVRRDLKLWERLGRIRGRLGSLGWDVVTERWMKNKVVGYNENTLQSIATKHGVSRERVRQVELQARVLLQRYLAEFSHEVNSEGAQNGEQVTVLYEGGLR